MNEQEFRCELMKDFIQAEMKMLTGGLGDFVGGAWDGSQSNGQASNNSDDGLGAFLDIPGDIFGKGLSILIKNALK